MKYIYYIIAILAVFSGISAYVIFDPCIEISKPFLSINDRIISRAEFERFLTRKPAYMSQDQFVETVIERQLLIQEAIKNDINKEKNFQSCIQHFYEQSLIKVLLDRKQASLAVDVAMDEVKKYKACLGNNFVITKMVYPSMEDMQGKTNGYAHTFESEFSYLSDDLQFIIFNLNSGETTEPKITDSGIVQYKLEHIRKQEELYTMEKFDIKRVSLFLDDKKKEALMNEWVDKIREKAEIWRNNE